MPMDSSRSAAVPVAAAPVFWVLRWSLLVLVLALLAAQAWLRAEPWTLDRALDVALKNNPDARIARERVAGAEALSEQARAAWYPQLSLQGRYGETNSPMMAFGSILNQRAFNFGLDFNHPGQIDDLNATGTVAYNIYSGGRASAGLAAAQGGARAAAQDLRAAQQQLGAEVVKAWLNIRKAREAVAAVEAGVQAYGAAVGVAQARFDAGQMLKADLLSLEVQLAETQENLAAARHGAALAERAFLYVLGLDAGGGTVELAADDPALARLVAAGYERFFRAARIARFAGARPRGRGHGARRPQRPPAHGQRLRQLPIRPRLAAQSCGRQLDGRRGG